jgi:hypothetical protein
MVWLYRRIGRPFGRTREHPVCRHDLRETPMDLPQ